MENKELLEGMRERLRGVLEEKGVSWREAGLKAGFGPSYVSGILKEGKDPQVSYLARLCQANGVSLPWILYGVEMSPETIELMEIFQSSPEKRDSILKLLRNH